MLALVICAILVSISDVVLDVDQKAITLTPTGAIQVPIETTQSEKLLPVYAFIWPVNGQIIKFL